jgi:hypothetical protein
MTTKFISLATAIVLLDVYLQSQLSSSDPLFLFASNNFAVNAGLLILGGLMVAVSFKDKFRYWWSFVGCSLLAVVCGTIGVIGTFFSNVLYAFPSLAPCSITSLFRFPKPFIPPTVLPGREVLRRLSRM